MKQEQIDIYLKSHGEKCPYCSSGDIFRGLFHTDGSVVWREITCEGCGKKWRNIYELKTIDERKYTD